MALGSHKMSFQATDRDALLAILRSMKIGQPPEVRGIRKEHAEPYAMAHLLSALAEAGSLLVFPLELVHGERPDFLLAMGGKRIGIEHTDARAESETHMNVLRIEMKERKEIESDWYIITPVEPGEPRRSTEEVKNDIKAGNSMSPDDSAGV